MKRMDNEKALYKARLYHDKAVTSQIEEDLQVMVRAIIGDYRLEIKHNKDGFYDAWIEIFWTEEKPDAETEEYYYMNRMYEKFLRDGIIEYYDYQYSSEEGKEAFLQKWNLEYGVPYSENEEISLYIGQRGKLGKFYECLVDFYMPQDSPRESDWWKLISKIIEKENS